MIRHAANRDCRAVELLGRAAQVGKRGLARVEVVKEREAVLGGEYQVNIDCR